MRFTNGYDTSGKISQSLNLGKLPRDLFIEGHAVYDIKYPT
jgi:hypothetical protein